MHTTVIIPFRPRGDASLLPWTLEGYANQILSPTHTADILLGVDGDETPTSLVPPPSLGPLQCSLHTFPRMGAAAVRNALVRQTSDHTDLLLFANADCRPAPNLLQTHADTMATLPPNSLILGSAPFEPRPNPTVFDVFLHETPILFDYQLLRPNSYATFWTPRRRHQTL